MFAKLKRKWHAFTSARPGQRFQAFHERQQRRKPGVVVQVLWMAAGIGLVLVGAFLLVVPGPGILVIALGGALLASRSTKVAGILDRTELEVRKLKGWVVRKLEKA